MGCILWLGVFIELPPKKNLKLSAARLRRLSEFSQGGKISSYFSCQIYQHLMFDFFTYLNIIKV